MPTCAGQQAGSDSSTVARERVALNPRPATPREQAERHRTACPALRIGTPCRAAVSQRRLLAVSWLIMHFRVHPVSQRGHAPKQATHRKVKLQPKLCLLHSSRLTGCTPAQAACCGLLACPVHGSKQGRVSMLQPVWRGSGPPCATLMLPIWLPMPLVLMARPVAHHVPPHQEVFTQQIQCFCSAAHGKNICLRGKKCCPDTLGC